MLHSFGAVRADTELCATSAVWIIAHDLGALVDPPSSLRPVESVSTSEPDMAPFVDPSPSILSVKSYPTARQSSKAPMSSSVSGPEPPFQ